MNVSQIIDAQLLLYLSKLNKLHGEKKVLIFPYGFDECRKVLVWERKPMLTSGAIAIVDSDPV